MTPISSRYRFQGTGTGHNAKNSTNEFKRPKIFPRHNQTASQDQYRQTKQFRIGGKSKKKHSKK